MMTIGLPTEPQKPRTPFDEWAEPYRLRDFPGWLDIPELPRWITEPDAKRIFNAGRCDVLREAMQKGVCVRERDGALHLDV